MRRFVVCFMAGTLTASAALGQSLTGPVTQGAVPPGQSFSLQDDGSSLAGNPAANISDIEKVEIVFKDGVGYDSEKLIQSVQGLVGIR